MLLPLLSKRLKRSLLTLACTLLPASAFAQLNVVTTTGMIADLVQQVGGDKVNVTSLMQSGVDPHLYKATQGDIRRLTRADIIFYNGLHLEGKLHDIFQKMKRKKAVYAVSAYIAINNIITHDKVEDPHIWFDITLWQNALQLVAQKLSEHAPQYKVTFAQNSQRYHAQLAQLHDWVTQQIHTIPAEQRVLITAHDAFSYFGRAYGIQVLGLQGINTAAEFGLQDIKQLKDKILRHKVPAVFIESSVSPKYMQALVAGVAAEGKSLTIGGELYSDALGPKGTATGNYIGMVKHNINTLVNALTQKDN